jgi:Na+/phosphate symporter
MGTINAEQELTRACKEVVRMHAEGEAIPDGLRYLQKVWIGLRNAQLKEVEDELQRINDAIELQFVHIRNMEAWPSEEFEAMAKIVKSELKMIRQLAPSEKYSHHDMELATACILGHELSIWPDIVKKFYSE